MKKLLLLLFIPIVCFGQIEKNCYEDDLYNPYDNNLKYKLCASYDKSKGVYISYKIYSNDGTLLVECEKCNASKIYNLNGGRISYGDFNILQSRIDFDGDSTPETFVPIPEIGNCKSYYPNGVLREEGVYKDYESIGLEKNYWINGNLRSIIDHPKDGSSYLTNGTYYIFCENKMFISSKFVNGLKVSYYCDEYDYKGRKRTKGGIESIMLHKNGNIVSSIAANYSPKDRSADRRYYKDMFGDTVDSWADTEEIIMGSWKKKTMFDIDFITYDKHLNVKSKLKEISNYNLREMVNFFIDNCRNFGINVPENKITASFEALEGNVIAMALGRNIDDEIIIKVDPESWANSSPQKRWYVLYHELGHDVLNLSHGETGKMMFNFVDRDYTWDEFSRDRYEMFNNYLFQK